MDAQLWHAESERHPSEQYLPVHSPSKTLGKKEAGMEPSELAAILLDAFKTLLSESESYVQYFELRFRLEEEHLRSLQAMLERQRDLDMHVNRKLSVTPGMLPDTNTLSGLRNTWGDIRLSEMWAVDLRLQALKEWKCSTLQPIAQFRHAQERVMRRVKEDLRACVDDYNDMRLSTLPRIRKTYEKRCEELEMYRHQQRALEEQRILLSTAHEPPAPQESIPLAQNDTIRPVIDRSATHTPTDRSFAVHNSSPHSGVQDLNSSTNSLTRSPSAQVRSSPAEFPRKKEWDKTPKRLNALFSRMLDVSSERIAALDVSDNALPHTQARNDLIPPSLSVNQKSQQLLVTKLAKAKRDMEESDKAYRKAIFDLETLRIRRRKALSAAASSILEWRRDLALTMSKVCVQHANDTLSIRTSIDSVHKHDEHLANHMLDGLENEQHICEEWLPNTRLLAPEDCVQYINYWHGPYNDLIFGTSLVDYAFSHGDATAPSTMTEQGLIMTNVRPPMIVSKCIQFMEQPRSLQTAGIYRVNAKLAHIQKLTSAIEQNESVFQFDMKHEDPAAVAGILKLYLRQLPEAVMPMRVEERVKYTHEREEHIRNGFAMFKSRIRRMPPIHQSTLRALLLHLVHVASHASKNMMTVSNLAVIFSPVVLFDADYVSSNLASAAEEDCAMEDLILFCHDIFAMPPGTASLLSPVPPTSEGPPDDSAFFYSEHGMEHTSAPRPPRNAP
ncbi:hypothetical protein MVES1_000402 [Malassezia vespertilionis]|uniref:uncharacterized protein n=1 Tax=Malassezia vespertilionis TaxID=2020962 RepID=UPI0024B0F4EB|nr:uncharacterized protein MVES1_000402 [Malassezia vespertilionis]WFD05076.1 hypothetical protein MVES1_000402 [Malassezia vespertilionis]